MAGKNFFKKIPYLVGGSISDADRDRASQVFEVIYQYELDNPKSAFARNDEDIADPYNRFKIFFDMLRVLGGDTSKIRYTENLMLKKSLESYEIKKGEPFPEQYKDLPSKTFYPEIDEAYEEESSKGFIWWNS